MTPVWIVVVEATGDEATAPLDEIWLSRLMEAVADARPIALYHADRYALQLRVSADDPMEALQAALERWSEGVRAVGAPAGTVVRADVMTLDEFTLELQAGQAHDDLASELRWRLLLEGSQGHLITLSSNGTITLSHPPLDPGLLLSTNGQPTLADIVHPDDATAVHDKFERLVAGEFDMARFMARLRRDEGWRSVQVTVRNLLEEPLIRAIVINAEDSTERDELADRLHYVATHDELTGLANRAAFLDAIDLAVAKSSDVGPPCVFCVDVSHYRDLVERFGEDACNQLLVTLAERLTRDICADAIAARLCEAEIALLCPNVDGSESAAQIAKRIADALSAPVVIDGEEVTVTVSIGVALAYEWHNASTVLRHAEVAVHRAWHARARYEVFRRHQPSQTEAEQPR